tara:strand:+ start:403 stop:1278 length:876 start_codon:yes stop_codon:yes gene_type:complete
MKSWIKKKINKVSVVVSGLLSVPYGKQLEKFFSNIVDETPSVYDKAIDKFYNDTGIGSYLHRLFDHSHSPVKMWEKVRDALPNDSNVDELKNYFISMVKDLQTPMGIPLHNIENKEAYDLLVSKISSTFLIKKQWLYDIQEVNLLEVFSSTLGVVALFFGWKKKDKEEFAELCASLGLAGAVGANPLLLIISLVSLAKAYTQNKNKNKFNKGSLRGFVGMGSFIMTASLFSSPIIGVIIGLAVAISVKKSLKKLEFQEVHDWFKENITKYADAISSATGITYLYKKIKNFV